MRCDDARKVQPTKPRRGVERGTNGPPYVQSSAMVECVGFKTIPAPLSLDIRRLRRPNFLIKDVLVMYEGRRIPFFSSFFSTHCQKSELEIKKGSGSFCQVPSACVASRGSPIHV